MNKIWSISVIFALVVVVTAFTGCTDDSRTKIDGVLVNEITDQSVGIYFKNDVTGEEGYMGVGANKSISYGMSVGQYTITAKYHRTSDFPNELIGTAELDVRATDDTYAIIVRSSSVSAWSS